MKVRNIFSGQEFEARWSFRDSACSRKNAQPVLLLEPDGRAVDSIFFEVIDNEGKTIEEDSIIYEQD